MVLEGFAKFCRRIGGSLRKGDGAVSCILPADSTVTIDVVQTRVYDIEKKKYLKRVKISLMHPAGDFEFFTNNDIEARVSFTNGKGFTTYTTEGENKSSSFFAWLDEASEITLTEKKGKLSIEVFKK